MLLPVHKQLLGWELCTQGQGLHLVSASLFITSATANGHRLMAHTLWGHLVIISTVIRAGHKDNSSKYPNCSSKSQLSPTAILGGIFSL